MVLDRGYIKRDEQGRAVRMIGAMLDVTQRVQAEEALRERETRYRSLYEGAAIGIFHSTFAGRFLDVNPALAHMLGYDSPQEVVDSIDNIAEQIYVTPPRRDQVIDQMLAAGKTITVENRYRRKNDSEWDAYLHLRYITDDRGQPQYLEGFVEDISERKRAERQLARQAQELARSNADLEPFAYIISHDLQEPLRAVDGYLQMLQRQCEQQFDAQVHEYIADAVDGATRMQTMIKALMSLSRVNTRGQEFDLTDCEELLGDTLRTLHWPIADCGAVVTHDPLPTVKADASQLSQVFQNLIANATSSAGREKRHRCTSRPSASAPNGALPCGTMASVSTCTRPNGSFRSFSGCTRAASTRAPASAWRSAGASSNATAGASGSKARRIEAPLFISRSRQAVDSTQHCPCRSHFQFESIPLRSTG